MCVSACGINAMLLIRKRIHDHTHNHIHVHTQREGSSHAYLLAHTRVRRQRHKLFRNVRGDEALLEKKDKDDEADYLHQQADEDQALFQCLQCVVCASGCVCVRRERGRNASC